MLNDIPYSDIIKFPGMIRWHMVRVKRSQTLAEHVAMVAMISAKMTYSYAPYLIKDIALVYEYALIHDTHEIKFGDLPTPVKKASDGELDNTFSKMYWEGLGVSVPDIEPEIVAIVQLADKIEALMYYSIEGYDEIQDGVRIKDVLSTDLMHHALFMKEKFHQEWPNIALEVLEQFTPPRPDAAPQQEEKEAPPSKDTPTDRSTGPA